MIKRTLEMKDINESLIKKLELSKFATPNVDKQFIHFDRLDDGTWRLLFNVKDVDVRDIATLTFYRENDDE